MNFSNGWEAIIEASRLNDESDEPGLTYSIALATIGRLEAALAGVEAASGDLAGKVAGVESDRGVTLRDR
ncbi:MAG: hypothetical protein CR217_01400 [Beijerinckiaceae bacterium]|nr:MAG: hypothetical protein CR217_01400 [Beijerinckiaceae bacterium]